MNNVTFLGNKALLNLPKTAFLSSRRISSEAVLKCYDWATAQRDAGRCVISGFHSSLEKDVLRFLLKGRQPIIVVIARKLYAAIPEDFVAALDEGRMLLVSTSTAARASETTTRRRNQYIVDHADHIVIGALAPNGNLVQLVKTLPPDKVTLLTA
jgi:predicted Rossmann fold nucleotide-binding protein DprA/Smf involved in DNA uptake